MSSVMKSRKSSRTTSVASSAKASLPVSASVSASVPASASVSTTSVAPSSAVASALLSLNSVSSRALSGLSGSSSVFVNGSIGGSVLSNVELSILRAENPIDVQAEDEISVFGERGIWVNKDEVSRWKGSVDISAYPINEDHEPEVVTKKPTYMVEYVQELAIRYLRPPTPPAPGEIIITQEPDTATAPAPPIIIRQQPSRPETPEPLVIREAPPPTPKPVAVKQITIAGKQLPPPARKVVIERLAPIPAKAQNVIIERWLPYVQAKRQVIFNKADQVQSDSMVKNVVIEWEAPDVRITKQVRYLGLEKAYPSEYREKYASYDNYFASGELPEVVHAVETPGDIGQLASEQKSEQTHELEGDLEGFELVDLDAEGLAEYREQLFASGIRDLGAVEF